MATSPFEIIGLNRSMVKLLLRDPKRLRSFLSRYRRDLGTVTHTDVSDTVHLREEQEINAAFDQLEGSSDDTFRRIGTEYYGQSEQDSYSARLGLQSAVRQNEQLKADIKSQQSNFDRQLNSLNAGHSSRILELASVGQILPAHLATDNDAGVFPDQLMGTVIISLVKLAKRKLGQNVERINAIEFDLLYVDSACRLWAKRMERSFFGSFIGSEISKQAAIRPSLTPTELAAFEQVRMDIAAETKKLVVGEFDRSWKCHGILVGSYRKPERSRRTVRNLKPIHGTSQNSAQIASKFLDTYVTGKIDLELEQTSLATVWTDKYEYENTVSEIRSDKGLQLHTVRVLLVNRFRHLELPSLNLSRSK